MFEDYIITKHAIERYMERIDYNRKDAIKRIQSDLYFKKVKRIINNGDTRHVFTNNSKEFIFKKDAGTWILKTVIKRTRHTNQFAMDKRKTLAYA
jgi:hypothetical protein